MTKDEKEHYCITLQNILQNAISAQYVYQVKTNIITIIINIINLLTILTPIALLNTVYIAKGTSGQNLADTVSTIISTLLIILSIASFILGLDKAQFNYSIGYRDNKMIENKARNLLARLLNSNSEINDLDFFLDLTTNMDCSDNDRVGWVPTWLQKRAYRESLKRSFLSGEALCPICNASPYRFKKGSCQACGNTPAENKEKD